MITTKRAALAEIRRYGWLNYFAPSPGESWFSIGREPGADPAFEDEVVKSSTAWALIDAGALRREGGSNTVCWYREQPRRG